MGRFLQIERIVRVPCQIPAGSWDLYVAYRILESIISDRLNPYVMSIFGPYQCGFTSPKSTIDQLFKLRKKTDFHLPPLSRMMRQAYDTSNRDELYQSF